MKNPAETPINWNKAIVQLKEQFPILSDNDVLFIEGREEEMVRRLEVKIGKTKAEIIECIHKI